MAQQLDSPLAFEGDGLDGLARDLRGAALSVRAEVTKTVWKIGAELADQAKVISKRHSQSIPGTIHFTPLPDAARIRAGDAQVALAALYELGNRGRGNRLKPTFRHPLFGNKKYWYDQKRYPFLAPALAIDRRAITKQMEAAWDRALTPYRLRPDASDITTDSSVVVNLL